VIRDGIRISRTIWNESPAQAFTALRCDCGSRWCAQSPAATRPSGRSPPSTAGLYRPPNKPLIPAPPVGLPEPEPTSRAGARSDATPVGPLDLGRVTWKRFDCGSPAFVDCSCRGLVCRPSRPSGRRVYLLPVSRPDVGGPWWNWPDDLARVRRVYVLPINYLCICSRGA
jgi:hypothetical protein